MRLIAKLLIMATVLGLCGCEPQVPKNQVFKKNCEISVVAGRPHQRPDLQIITTPRYILAVLSSDALFINNTIINPSQFKALNHIVSLIKNHPEIRHIKISAYSDDLKSNHTIQKNTSLQANTVAAYLWEHGIPRQMISAKHYGRSPTQSSNLSNTGRADNRRIEVKLMHRLRPPMG